jgi:hypothetical protein
MITDELEQELRSVLARSAEGTPLPPQARQRLLQRDYHPRRVNRGLAASLAAATVAAATVAAAGVAVPLTADGRAPQAAAGAVIQLASHTFRMPAGYKLTAATSLPCRPIATFPLRDAVQPPHAKGPFYRTPSYGAGMKAAASASGGCIVALLFRPYTPAMPASQAFGGHLVQVGRYHGALFHLRIYVFETSHGRPAGHGGRPVKTTFTELFVRLPAGHGMVRDLVIGAQDLSGPALIKIAANGLSS